MRFHIQATLKEGPWGGGNQFLKALRRELEKTDAYEPERKRARAILFNSYQDIPAFFLTLITRPRVRRAWRLGPIFSLHRKGFRWYCVDAITAVSASLFAQVVIFQSHWSLAQARRRGFFKCRNVFVIHNAVDSSIFFPSRERHYNDKAPHLIYTSWSSNEKKGFSYLHLLDRTLDHTRYRMTFLGNTHSVFHSIAIQKAPTSKALADALRENDIFISPTKDDACSNALIEALACGLPVVALASGGNPELVGKGGELFHTEQELLGALEKVVSNYAFYRDNIHISQMSDVARAYRHAICDSIKSNDKHS